MVFNGQCSAEGILPKGALLYASNHTGKDLLVRSALMRLVEYSRLAADADCMAADADMVSMISGELSHLSYSLLTRWSIEE